MSSINSGSQLGDLAPRGHLAKSTYTADCYKTGVGGFLLASTGWRPRILLKHIQCRTGETQQQRVTWLQRLTVLRQKSPDLEGLNRVRDSPYTVFTKDKPNMSFFE